MPNANKIHVSNINAKDFNFLFFFLLIIAILGSVFLAWNEFLAGTIYTIMSLTSIAFLSILFLALKDDNSLKPITNFMKIPIATNLNLAVIFYLIGFMAPLGINIFVKTLSSFSITSLSIPLFGNSINSGFQSFSTAQIGGSSAWEIFTVMFSAGTIETLAFNFVAPLVGVFMGLLVFQLLSDGKKVSFISKKIFVFVFGILFSVVLFTVSHLLNQNYTTQSFIIAAIFLIVSNISIYYFGVFLMFWVGYHQANNLIWLIEVNGFNTIFQGFISLFGLIFAISFALLLFYALRNRSQIQKDLSKWLGA